MSTETNHPTLLQQQQQELLLAEGGGLEPLPPNNAEEDVEDDQVQILVCGTSNEGIMSDFVREHQLRVGPPLHPPPPSASHSHQQHQQPATKTSTTSFPVYSTTTTPPSTIIVGSSSAADETATARGGGRSGPHLSSVGGEYIICVSQTGATKAETAETAFTPATAEAAAGAHTATASAGAGGGGGNRGADGGNGTTLPSANATADACIENVLLDFEEREVAPPSFAVSGAARESSSRVVDGRGAMRESAIPDGWATTAAAAATAAEGQGGGDPQQQLQQQPQSSRRSVEERGSASVADILAAASARGEIVMDWEVTRDRRWVYARDQSQWFNYGFDEVTFKDWIRRQLDTRLERLSHRAVFIPSSEPPELQAPFVNRFSTTDGNNSAVRSNPVEQTYPRQQYTSAQHGRRSRPVYHTKPTHGLPGHGAYTRNNP